jgi:poly(hydroxyalkanoate) granule-associated protein
MSTKKRTATPSLAGAARRAKQGEMLEAMHQIWLAGVGAIASARKRGPKVLDELLEEGARIHESSRKAADKAVRSALSEVQFMVGDRMRTAQTQAGDTLDNLEKIFQTRVHRVLNQLGVPSGDEIAALAKRVDALKASLGGFGGTRRGSRKKTSRARGARKASTARPRGKRAA